MAKIDIGGRIATLEHHINENFFEIQRRLDECIKFQDRAKVNFLEVERKLVEFDKKFGEAPVAQAAPSVMPTKAIEDVESRLQEKIKSLEDILMLLELEVVRAKERPALAIQELGITPTVPTVLEDRLRTLEEKFGMLEKLKLRVPVELAQHEPRLKSMEDNILSVQRSLREEANRLEDMIGDRTVTEQSAERFVTKTRESMTELRRDLEKAEMLKHEILTKEHAFATRPDIEAFEARIRAEVNRIHDITDRVTAAEKSIDSKLVDIETKLEDGMKEFQSKLTSDTKDFQNKFRKEVEAHVQEYAGSAETLRKELETHSKSFGSKIVDLETALREEFETHRRSFDSKIVDLEERVVKVAAEMAVEESRKDVDAALAKHRKEINELISDLQNELARIKPILTAEKVDALLQRVNTIERDLESHATAVVTKELAAFSEAIDKKFPDLVTKADFAQWSHATAQRIQTIEAPDISPLADRIDKLEFRLHELASLIKEIAVRMPIVVE